MMNQTQLIESLRNEKIIAIVRGLPVDIAIKVGQALYEGGIRFIEVTFNQSSPTCIQDTSAAITALSELYDDCHVGAGTVITMEQLQAAKDAGAKYIISPNTDTDIIKRTVELGMLSMPGAYSPTEAVVAHQAGATFIKLFPSETLGPTYIKALTAPLSHMSFLAVGGVNDTNMADFYKAGALGFGIGGNIVNKQMIDEGNFSGLADLAKRYVAAAAKL